MRLAQVRYAASSLADLSGGDLIAREVFSRSLRRSRGETRAWHEQRARAVERMNAGQFSAAFSEARTLSTWSTKADVSREYTRALHGELDAQHADLIALLLERPQVRGNMDEEYRRAEREVAFGDEAAQARLLSAKLRAGEVRLDAVRLASILGRRDAYAVVGSPYEPFSGYDAYGRTRTISDSPRAIELLSSLGVRDSVMWAYETAMRSLRTGPIADPERDALFVGSLLEWLLDEDAITVVERAHDVVDALDYTGVYIDATRWRVILRALKTPLGAVLRRGVHSDAEWAAKDAEGAGIAAAEVAWEAAEERGEAREAKHAELAKQREALAKIVLGEALPFDDEGRPRVVVGNHT